MVEFHESTRSGGGGDQSSNVGSGDSGDGRGGTAREQGSLAINALDRLLRRGPGAARSVLACLHALNRLPAGVLVSGEMPRLAGLGVQWAAKETLRRHSAEEGLKGINASALELDDTGTDDLNHEEEGKHGVGEAARLARRAARAGRDHSSPTHVSLMQSGGGWNRGRQSQS